MNSPNNFILASNLEIALCLAILELERQESHYGPDYKSTLRAGLEENLKGLREGRGLLIRYDS